MTTAMPPVVETFIEVINHNDSAAFPASFPADGVVDDWGSRYVGHDAISVWNKREFIGKKVALKVTGVEQEGYETSITADVGGNGFNGLSRFVFVVNGTLIQEMRITAS